MPSVFRAPVGDRTWQRRSASDTPPPAAPAPGAGPGAATAERRPGIVAGFLAPHPPQLLYAENPPQNEPRSEGGWEGLRWAYEHVRARVRELAPDVIVLHAPHWITMVGHHVNCVPNPRGFSVEPIFPHLLRYRYDFRTDVELAEAIADQASDDGLVTRKLRTEGVRVDYATITALHLLNPDWDVPIVSLSANNNPYFYSTSSLEQMEVLGESTRKAIEATGRRAIVAGSNSLSHLHWDREPELPEDMSHEHAYDNHQYRWDMRLLELIRAGRTRELRAFIPEHIAATESETKAGSLTWMLSALGWPEGLGEVLAYGTVIGTGNAVCAWDPIGGDHGRR
jgi:2-aminophenol/2-amino-5-chlorophenol 1,6-dioxygenase beta subunit